MKFGKLGRESRKKFHNVDSQVMILLMKMTNWNMLEKSKLNISLISDTSEKKKEIERKRSTRKITTTKINLRVCVLRKNLLIQ